MRLHGFVVLSLLSLLLGACADDKFAKAQKLQGLRVLGIHAASPEIGVGESTSMTPIMSYVDLPDSVNLTHEAVVCADPGVSYGAEASCDGNPLKVQVLAPTPVTLTTTSKTQAIANAFSVSAPADYLDDLTDAQKQVGRSLLVVYKVSSSLGNSVKVVSRVLVSARAEKISNPTLTAIQGSDGQSLTALPTNGSTLKAIASTPKGGEVVVSWYVSDGNFKVARTLNENSTTFELGTRSTIPFVLVAVVRNQDGALDYSILEF